MQYLPEYLRGTFCRCLELLSLWPAFSSPVPCPVISSCLGLLALAALSLQLMESFGFCMRYSSSFYGLQTLRAVGWAIEGLTSLVTCLSGITVLPCLMSRDLETTIIPLLDSIKKLRSILPLFFGCFRWEGTSSPCCTLSGSRSLKFCIFKKEKEGYCG